MKKIKILVLCLLLICTSGCSSTKDAIDKDFFVNVLTENKYTVYEATDEFDYATVALIATKNDIKFTFVEGKKRYDIEGIFIDECKNAYSAAGSDYDSNTHGGKNWTNLTITNKTNYYFVGWIGNTYMFVEAPIEDKGKVVSIISELGY